MMTVNAIELTACVYLRIQCGYCGEVRLATSEEPQSPCLICPLCGTEGCPQVVLGKGRTRRFLPFAECIAPRQTEFRRQPAKDLSRFPGWTHGHSGVVAGS